MKRRSIGKLYNNQSYNYCHKTFFLFEKLQFFFYNFKLYLILHFV